jgi:putative FmdB family regulatory protein
MPIYEYKCTKCNIRFSTLVRSWTETTSAVCPQCGSDETKRIISSFAYHKSTQTIHEESGEPSLHSGANFYKDPRNIGRWTEKKFQDIGMEVPREIKEEINAAREGKLPDDLTE